MPAIMKSQTAKLTGLIMATALLVALAFSFAVPSAGVQSTAKAYPEPGAEVKPPGPEKITYTNDSDVFADFADLFNRPSGVDYEQGKLLVVLHVYRPDGTEIPGNVTDSGLSEGEEPPSPYERLTLMWKRTGGGALPSGQYRVVVQWVDTGARVDEWAFTLTGPAPAKEYFQVFDGDQLLNQFDTLDAAKSWARTKAYELKRTLVIKSTATGKIVATVEYVGPPVQLPSTLFMGPLASLVNTSGRVAVVNASGEPFTVSIGQDIPLGAYVVVGSGSSAVLSQGGSQMTLGSNTVVSLLTGPLASLFARTHSPLEYPTVDVAGNIAQKRLEYELPPYSDQFLQADMNTPRIVLVEGMLTASVSQVDPATGFRIYTPDSVAEAKGTEIEVSASASGLSRLTVRSGEATFSDLVKGKSVLVKEGQVSEVTPSTNPSVPQQAAGEAQGLLAQVPVWVWVAIAAGAAVIVALLAIIVALLVIRRKPKAA